MFKIYDGRNCFFQWDLNQKLIVFDDSITEVHFYNGVDTCALVCEVYESGELRLVNVPNILLQSDFKLKVWGYAEDHTKQEFTFKVCTRSKPADYIYTETEVKNYEKFEERLAALEKNSDLSEYVKKTDIATVNDYGVVKVSSAFGVGIATNGLLYTKEATNAQIDAKTDIYTPITPHNLEYAVNSVVGKQIGDIDTALSNIIAIQDGYIYGTMSLTKGGEE